MRGIALAVSAGAMLIAVAPEPVQAAPNSFARAPAKVVPPSPVRPVAAVNGEGDDTNCSTHRKRLWVESEGWVVRKIKICR